MMNTAHSGNPCRAKGVASSRTMGLLDSLFWRRIADRQSYRLATLCFRTIHAHLRQRHIDARA